MRNITVWSVCSLLLVLVAGCPRPRPNDPMTGPEKVAVAKPATFAFSLCSSGLPEDGMWKCDPVFADVDGDGFVDLAALARLGQGPRLWKSDGTGSWQEFSTGMTPGMPSCGGGLDFADVNGDGRLDLVVADHCQGIFVYLSDGAGDWKMVVESMCPLDLPAGSAEAIMHQGAEDLSVGDVNGDGMADIVASSSDEGGINVYLGDGTGTGWHKATTGLPDTGWANRVLLVDLNSDDVPDLLASYADGPRVWLNGGDGSWLPGSTGLPTPVLRGLYTGIAAGDINEDGLVDISLANWIDGPEVYLQQADGSWRKTADVFPEMLGGAVGLALGDLDGNGHLDMVVSGRLTRDGGYVRGVFALRGDGTGQWDYDAGSGLPETGLSATTGIALADLNGDGLLEVAAGSGLIVETVPGSKAPIIPTRLLVWCAQPLE